MIHHVGEVGAYLGEGIRRAIVASALRADAGPDQPALILLRHDDLARSSRPRPGSGSTRCWTRPADPARCR